MKCEICLWRRRGIGGGAGNQELRGGRSDLGDVCVGLQAAVFQPAVACSAPVTAPELLYENRLAKKPVKSAAFKVFFGSGVCVGFFFFFVITLSCSFSCVWARLTSRNSRIMEAAVKVWESNPHIYCVRSWNCER